MSLETDELAEAAQRFSEALRAERGRRVQETGARFVFGLAIGAAAGIAAIYLVSQRASEESRLGIAASPLSLDDGAGLRERLRRAVEDGRRAARGREEELWQLYRQQTEAGQQPSTDDLLY
jgi:hypothetical protein